MNIKDVAENINKLSKNFEMSNFQSRRQVIHKLSRIPAHQIFSKRTIFDKKDKYAFHYGGRSEIQYNIGYEEDSKVFRYGLAFSLESSQSLKDPIGKLKPKIERFNEYFLKYPDKFYDIQLWYYRKSKRSKNERVRVIDVTLIQDKTFIFIGKYFEKAIAELDEKDYKEILRTFDKLLDVYEYVETNNIIEEKIARICWNEYNWQRPSGPNGKSNDKDSYEFQTGYGHEEWLFDTGKIINGYHYGYLQQIKDKYRGAIFNISFYSINSKTGEKWWIGRIKNVQIISKEASKSIYDEYQKKGWIKEMVNQLKVVGANIQEFGRVRPEIFFNLKYKIDDLELMDRPLRVLEDDESIKSYYYSSFLNKETEPKLEAVIDKKFSFNPQYKPRKEATRANYGKRETDVDLFHNRMIGNSYKQLVKIFGKQNVGEDLNTGLGSKIDLVVQNKDSYIFYEFKTSNTIRSCIREALAQLLEYAYYPNQRRAQKLIIVSHNKINKEAQEYLELLRKSFKIPVYYRYYNSENDILEETEY